MNDKKHCIFFTGVKTLIAARVNDHMTTAPSKKEKMSLLSGEKISLLTIELINYIKCGATKHNTTMDLFSKRIQECLDCKSDSVEGHVKICLRAFWRIFIVSSI